MTIVLRPIGRGNWATAVLQLSGRRAPPPMYFNVGQRLELAPGMVFRVVEVRV